MLSLCLNALQQNGFTNPIYLVRLLWERKYMESTINVSYYYWLCIWMHRFIFHLFCENYRNVFWIFLAFVTLVVSEGTSLISKPVVGETLSFLSKFVHPFPNAKTCIASLLPLGDTLLLPPTQKWAPAQRKFQSWHPAPMLCFMASCFICSSGTCQRVSPTLGNSLAHEEKLLLQMGNLCKGLLSLSGLAQS